MNLYLTKKLSDKLKVEIEDLKAEEYSDLENFHCNLLKFGRDNCLLITNDKTLFSFVLYGLKAQDFKNFEFVLKERAFKILLGLRFIQEEIEKVLECLEDINYSKTHDRSVLSYMNDMKKQIESYLYMGDDIYEINRKINKTPYSKLKFSYSIEHFRELLKS